MKLIKFFEWIRGNHLNWSLRIDAKIYFLGFRCEPCQQGYGGKRKISVKNPRNSKNQFLRISSKWIVLHNGNRSRLPEASLQ